VWDSGGTLVPVRGDRVAAAGAIVTALAGTAGLVAASSGTGLDGYVSESGVSGSPSAGLYRVSIFAVAVAVALLAVAVRRASAPGAGLLALAVPFVVLSGSVRCSAGCPLPPYETATAADLVHAVASIVGTVLCAAAMLPLALPTVDRSVRLPSLVGVALAVPLGAASFLAILFAGRGALTGALERILLAVLLAWLVALATVRTVGRAVDRA
jgi:hypothetical protein